MKSAPKGASMGNCVSRCCTGANSKLRSNRMNDPTNNHQTIYEKRRSSSNLNQFNNCNAGDAMNIEICKEVSNNEATKIQTEAEAEKSLLNLFERYRDSDDVNCILAYGCERFCNDLGLKPDDFHVLVLSYNLNASNMAVFTKAEFLNGCRKMNSYSIDQIKKRIPSLVNELLTDRQAFKCFYKWTFDYGLDLGQRSLKLDMAVALWQLVFLKNQPPLLKRWLHYLEKSSGINLIAKDTWAMFLNLVEQVGDDLSTYDESEAWPSLFDDFVEWENDRKNQNIADG